MGGYGDAGTRGSALSPRRLVAASLLCILCFASGCGSVWHGRIVYLEDGKIVIQPQNESKIESGRKLLIYRQKTITHPVTGEVLGTIRDNIAEVPVLRIGKRVITAIAAEPEFSMITLDDQATAARGSVKTTAGSVQEVGKVREVDAERKSAEVEAYAHGAIASGGILTVIRYTETVTDPDTGEVLAVAVEPVANLQAKDAGADGQFRALYDLIDKKLGWVEVDDVVVNRNGNMANEKTLWFQDPPDGFSQAWIFSRSYLHAIRYYDSGSYREAILELEDVVQMDPGYKDAAYLLGLCYMNLNRQDEAVTLFKNLLERNTDDSKTWTALAYAYLKQGKLQDAVGAYEKLAHLVPSEPKVWIDIGDIYRILGDHQKAEESYRKALEIDADDEEAVYELHSPSFRQP